MSERLKDHIQIFHDHGIYLPTKTMSMFGEVDSDSAAQWVKNIHILDSFTGTINVKLNSEGGSVESAKMVYDAISGCKNMVRITCYGNVESAATLILMAGDERIMTDSSKLMLHIGEEAIASNHPKNVESQYNDYKDEAKWMEDVYLSRIKQKKARFSRQKLQEMLLFDKYIKPKEALQLGLITLIGEVQ